jgi:CBS domain-containing protein
MTRLFGIELVPAAVREAATFLEAAETLAAHPVSAVAILDGDGRVVGMFRNEDLLEGLFPPYLKELRHTAFATDDDAILRRRAGAAAAEPVVRHMMEPVTVDTGTSATHVAELFLHHDVDALPVVEDARFVGMLGRAEFCREMLRRETAVGDA